MDEGQIEPVAENAKNGRDLFINGIGKKDDTLISLFEISAIVEEKDNN